VVNLPRYITHADWGTNPNKRQVAVAQLAAGDHYQVVGLDRARLGTEVHRDLRLGLGVRDTIPGQLLAGFDFPLGLPRAYAARAGISEFCDFFFGLARGAAPDFARVATTPEEISIERPFYPARPGGTRQRHLFDALGLTRQQIRRRCDGRDAESLFWTLGSKQVGKAALAGWDYLLGVERPELRLWPFDGTLVDLLDGDCATAVIAEVYPREFYQYFRTGPSATGRKTKREDRLRWMPGLLEWSEHLKVTFEAEVRGRIAAGFSDGPIGEDEFDAIVGLLGMIAVVTGSLGSGEPAEDRAVHQVEGWILGRDAGSPPAAVGASVHLLADSSNPALPPFG